eukprot:m.233351 g.233351  ORF g.233351 m.233351 type:complete len:4592 (-) comp10879_c0_seq1:411-14186(-)
MGDWEDPRADFLATWTLNTSKLKMDKWKKMTNVEELRQIIIDWFDKKELRQLIISADAKDQLTPSYEFPGTLKKKAVFFLKPTEMTITKDNVGTLIKGDLSSAPVEQMAAMVEGVFLPLLRNDTNTTTWPNVVADDVLSHAQSLQSSAFVVAGQMKGQTLLPLPVGTESFADEPAAAEGDAISEEPATGSDEQDDVVVAPAVSQSTVHAIESSVIEWTHQVREVLAKDSAEPLMNGEHPLPFFEVDFWKAKRVNLTNISKQLDSLQMRKMRAVLDEYKSSYAPAFAQLYADVAAGLQEAEDIDTHLEGLRRFLEDLEQAEMETVPLVMRQVFHICSLIWGHSKHYNTARHLVVLLREIMNLLIVSIKGYLEPNGLLKAEIPESLAKLRLVSKNYTEIRVAFDETRSAINKPFSANGAAAAPAADGDEEVHGGPWLFDAELVFGRISKYMERVDKLREIVDTAEDFFKLEKVELSGESLNTQVQDMFAQHTAEYEQMGNFAGYDCFEIDPDNSAKFNEAYTAYFALVKDFDRRLGAIACQAFDGATGLEASFKLVYGFSGLLERKVIEEEILERYPKLVQMFDHELDTVKIIFDEHKKHPKLGINQPQTAGRLLGVRQLRDRLAGPRAHFANINVRAFQTEEATIVFRKYDELLALFSAYEQEQFALWAKDVAKESDTNLNRPLLSRDPETCFISVNFDPQLVAVLREVKYLEVTANAGEIPKEAAEIYARNETFRQLVGNLDITVTEYNRVQDTLLDVEAPLVQGQLNDIDAIMERAISQLNWNSNGVAEYCLNLKNEVVGLSDRIQKAKANVEEIIDTMKKWFEQPLLMRDSKTYLLGYHERAKLMSNARDFVAKSGVRFHAILRENCALFKAAPETDAWTSYVKYLDDLILDGLYNTVHCSLSYLLDSMEKAPSAVAAAAAEAGKAQKDTAAPAASVGGVRTLLEGKMALVETDIVFTPAMQDASDPDKQEDTLMTYLSKLAADFFSVGALIPRLRDASVKQPEPERKPAPAAAPTSEGAEAADGEKPDAAAAEQKPAAVDKEAAAAAAAAALRESIRSSIEAAKNGPNYEADLRSNTELSQLDDELQGKALVVADRVLQYEQTILGKYKYLWTDDRNEHLAQFLKYGRILSAEELEQVAEGEIAEEAPTLEQFQANIDKYNAIADEVAAMDDMQSFEGWYRVDTRAFRSALHNTVKKWSLLFIQHLQEHVASSLVGLRDFVTATSKELDKDIPEGDYDALVKMMGNLNAVEERRNATDSLFEPLSQTVALLAKYDVEISPESHTLLSTLPQKWTNLKKAAENATSAVGPAQADEVAKLKRKANQFDVRNYEFREDFIKRAPSRFDAKNVYDRIDEHYSEYMRMEEEMDALAESAVLFSVKLPEYKQLRLCRRELGLLKTLWDLIYLVRAEFRSWQTTLWKEVNVETMDATCKRFLKDIRSLDKETRAWEAFNGVDAEVKNMVAALSAVGLLQSPAIRPRHWQQVMDATGVKIEMSEKTTLANLLALNLHEYEDEVSGIVDKANKEQGMEKMLRELDATWSNMNFSLEEHKRSKTPMLKTSEELIEVLEDNQVQLQNVLTSKYIAFFLTEVSGWQQKLSTADQVIEIWFEVQRTWSHLESIFIGSEDIRAQLPEDSKRFDGIDKDFKEVAHRSAAIPNVVECTNQPGLFDQLEDMQKRLALCEKALQEYLETKRLAFPRFYFVSSADLLDILSNGNQPELVALQLSKLFQMMANLKFDESDKNLAIGMYALDGEYVDFRAPTRCEGRVENWLMDLLVNMQETIREVMGKSVVAYEEKPRSEWVFDYPAQVSLVGTQIWWATEVNMAFARLEEGYENAMKEYNKKQINHLNDLIMLLQGKLSKAQRVMLQTICTVDVHSRDVVQNIIAEKAETADAFIWLSQLRHFWDDKDGQCRIHICDARFTYSYEYLGNVPRLVITPLTDRCYITLTQSLHLIMSGAPAGPAGTGKTETTKDLSRNLGIMIYVFNCSEQMDYKSVGNIYKGLSQTGAWGCFDEFNRISIEVLSVVAVQVKTIQDAIRAKKKRFNFLGEEISLNPTVGIYITMNPGYAGRTELPENIKALFRPCAMVVPDYGQICEIMLVSEGFLDAKLLARKFITLYTLNRDLLSKQDHYDWGLRAIKSVLVVAGSLKRADPDKNEDQVLMRALRDFNIPKIVNEDLPVFMGLISDLFPGVTVERKRDPEFEATIRKAILELNLQAEDSFVLKVVQLQELLDVRHSVFVLGGAATGKSSVLQALYKTYQLQNKKPVWADMNPKAVTNHELYGYINLATREWVDGLFSCVMRDIANLNNDHPKWMVMDGDIDTMWIESLNTVMDDNKVLTLASNERIALKPSMRLLFEIANLTYASPATVSRAGILFVNPTDLGWGPCVQSWIDLRDSASQKSTLPLLFDQYIPPCLDALRTRFQTITPITEWSMVNTLCKLLELLLTPENTPEGASKEDYELYFAWAAVWAFGGAMFKDQLIDWRDEFSKWWVTEFKNVKFPSGGTVFDYYIRPGDKKLAPWTEIVPEFTYDPELPLSAALVPTSETARVAYWMDLLMGAGHPVLLVGAAGTGKTALALNKLANLSDDWMVAQTSFNHYTTHHMIQGVLEQPLEKKAGRNYGPPGMKRLVYFVDDLNMPEVDLYGTASPHTVMRQHLDYNHWYDRVKKQLRVVSNTQYLCSMNPKAGSFTINPRLQRHFHVFAISNPGNEALMTIYSALFNGHLNAGGFSSTILKDADKIVESAIKLHTKVSTVFLPTAIKFHYIFNLRDLTNIFQGITFASSDLFKTPTQVVRLWMHESARVYSDKLVDEGDLEQFQNMIEAVTKENFTDLAMDEVLAKPNVHCHFALGIGEPKYINIKDYEALHTVLMEALNNYNEVNAAMNLVLFRDAMNHVCRISRILESPRGNALLVGVGGSGKQSLSRLAASISGLDTFQIALSKGYGMNELKADLANCFVKAGQKGQGVMFLMTDAQVADEKWLVLINDLLASGEIPDLFPADQRQDVIDALRGEVKGAGLEDNPTNCWNFFIDRVRRLLKVVLCFSPVGSTLRLRARKFPALVNCTSIDWFHEWPQDALISVSSSFLEETELIPAELKPSVSQFLAFVHTSVNETSKDYLTNERRHNYTTPKSFLEQIKLYKSLLTTKAAELQNNMDRMENGLTKLQSTAAQVDDLKEKLAAQEIELAAKNKAADELIEVVGIETEKVNKEKEIAAEEKAKVDVINAEVSAQQQECERDLAKAEPALKAAQEALDTLNKNNLTELKSFGAPPDIVVTVTAAVMCLLAKGKVPKDRSWKAAKVMMGNVGEFLDSLLNYDKENIPEANLKAVAEYLKLEDFNADFVRGKSLAAAGLCAWVCNIVTFNAVFKDVEPKRKALAEANEKLNAAQTKLQKIMDKIAKLDEALGKLRHDFQVATDDKLKCQQEADATNMTINLANRLVGGLASENVRWGEAVAKFKEQEKTLPGDVLMITAFISYAGCFSKTYRNILYDEKWLPFILEQNPRIPLTDNLDPLYMLTDNSKIARWGNEGLPADRVSTENATILTNAERWPLIIDPQEQGIKWIKQREGENLVVVRLQQKGYLDTIERAISNGDCMLIENLGEEVDPVLDNVLGRVTVKKGKCIMIGDKEVEYHPRFRLILHTKMANPHYKPEMQAQCTLINFTVTQLGLEDQLLADVVTAERPDLQELKAKLTMEQNQYMITLKELEDNLLARLSAAEGDFLKDEALVIGLEETKKTAAEIEEKVAAAKETELSINTARENYRPAAARASLLYFVLNQLDKMHPMYQVSLKAFNVVFQRAIATAPADDDVPQRVINIIETVTYNVYVYMSRGLFERDKLIFSSQMVFSILGMRGDLDLAELNFLLRSPSIPNSTSPVDFLSNQLWGSVKALSAAEQFSGFDRDIEGAAKRWKKFCEAESPENEKFPGEWKNKSLMQRLCMLRALRPDRMLYAMSLFVGEVLGEKYVANRSVEFATSYQETTRATGVFFILSPGVNPIKQVEEHGKKLGYTFDNGNYHQVSLGQGQEVIAERALDTAAKEGHWVVLENIHLVVKWLPALEKKIEECSLDAHENFRYYLTAEPASQPQYHIMPAGILQACIKITNEPPTGMQANLHAALDNFSQETLEMCAKENEFKKILFALVYFHAVVLERRKFGPMGWNVRYPFNTGDLTISVNVLFNYLESNPSVPWTDLRYLFGEIMYGGHITDNLDRRLCNTYLQEYMKPEMLDVDLELAPGFPLPPSSDYMEYHEYIDEHLPAESPNLYGMHSNAEIEFLTVTSGRLFDIVLEMQPRRSGGAGAGGMSREEKIKSILDDILEKLPEDFNMLELNSRCPPEERTPYTVVAFQETARMNKLISAIRESLKQLDLGLKGELTITAAMESLSEALFLGKVPGTWEKKAYPSTKPLAAWYADLLERIKFLEAWSGDFALPSAVWLGGLFNPQSFLTAIMQQTARKNEWPLDKMALHCDVTKKLSHEEFNSAPREGAYIYGMFMEGARWDVQSGLIQEARVKELIAPMPVIFIKAVPVDKLDIKGMYACPTFKTKERGRANEQVAVGLCPGFVWSLNLKTKINPNKWILAGVAMLLSE